MIQVPLEGPPWPDLDAVDADLRTHAPARHPGPEALAAAWRRAQHAWAADDAEALRHALATLAVDPPGANALEPVADGEVPTDAALARVALDRAPNAGEAAPTSLLGPFADALDVRAAPHRRLWTAAVAASAFVLHDDDDRSPMRSFLKEARKARSPTRDGFLAVARAPLAPWRVVAVGDGLGVAPRAPLAARACPESAVDLADVAALAPPAPGHLLVGRLVPAGGDRWVVRTGVVLPVDPPDDVVAAWVRQVEAPMRVAVRGLDVDDVLRSAGHRVLAAACRAAWDAGVRAPSPG